MRIIAFISKILFTLLFCFGLCSCSTTNTQTNQSSKNKTVSSKSYSNKKTKTFSSANKELSPQEDGGLLDFDSKVNNMNSYYSAPTPDGDLWDDIRGNMQLPDETENPEVQRQIAWLQSNQKYLQRVITRSMPYIHYIYQQTKERHMPSELALLPIIESAYNPLAYSKAGAMGLWQMMPGTATLLGLKVNWWYDGRRDLTASTKAALNYLAYLNNFFNNDWLLAIAGYNCGENRVQAAVIVNQKHGRPIDFWSLSSHLPQQTQNYVPKLLAFAAIVKDPERYNVTLPPINNAPYIEPIKIDSQMDLHQAAELANIDMKTIHELNPGYLRWATDPDGPSELLIPSDKANIFKQNLESLPETEKIIWRDYRAQQGDSIEEIAAKYNTETAILKRVNNLSSDNIKPKQHLLIPTNYHGDTQSEVVQQGSQIAKETMSEPKPAKKITTTKTAKTHLYIYKVNKGDTLYSLAKKFNSNPEDIKQINHIKNNKLQSGQIIKIPSNKAKSTVNQKSAHKKTSSKK